MKRIVPVSRLAATPAAGEEAAEVRQLVTFELLPGKTREARPLYKENAAMLRFRGHRESESRQTILVPVPELSVR